MKRSSLTSAPLPCLLLLALALPACATTTQKKPNLIFILVDALRWDHLGIYGYGRNTSPQIDAFARQGTVFEHVAAQASWTPPSVSSLFTGRYPQHNNLIHLEDPPHGTLAQWLRENGYATAAVVANPIMRAETGFGHGFDTYALLRWARAPDVLTTALAWIDDRDKERPFFLYLHFMDVHDPYRPRPPFRTKFSTHYSGPVNGGIRAYKKDMAAGRPVGLSDADLRQLIALYDGAIAFLDAHLRLLFFRLRQTGLADNTLIVFTSDHGDEFMDHGGVGHGHSLYEELVHLPLVVGGGAWSKPGTRYDGLVAAIDLAPSLLEVLRIPPAPGLHGKSFAPNVRSGTPFRDIAFSEVHRTKGFRAGSWALAARTSTHKLIFEPNTLRSRLFDLGTAAIEQEPVAGNTRSAALKEKLLAWKDTHGSEGTEPQPDDSQTLEALRALGYVE